jgi:hypothetical protein
MVWLSLGFLEFTILMIRCDFRDDLYLFVNKLLDSLFLETMNKNLKTRVNSFFYFGLNFWKLKFTHICIKKRQNTQNNSSWTHSETLSRRLGTNLLLKLAKTSTAL